MFLRLLVEVRAASVINGPLVLQDLFTLFAEVGSGGLRGYRPYSR